MLNDVVYYAHVVVHRLDLIGVDPDRPWQEILQCWNLRGLSSTGIGPTARDVFKPIGGLDAPCHCVVMLIAWSLETREASRRVEFGT